jgi:hypothetical protein
MNRTRYRVGPLLLGGALLALAGCDAGSLAAGDDPPPAAGAEEVPAVDARHRVDVFVVWGASNACGLGQGGPSVPAQTPEVARRYVAPYNWDNGGGTPYSERFEDPVHCRNESTGSAWPTFALTYNRLTERTVFLASVARGGSRIIPEDLSQGTYWHPGGPGVEPGLYYEEGVQVIRDAMAFARSRYRNALVAFGGVIWTQGNDLLNDGVTLQEYQGRLEDLLRHFGEDVVADPNLGGRLYFINTVADRGADLEDVQAYLAAEAAVCASPGIGDYCAIVQKSLAILDEYEACVDDPSCYPDRHLLYRDDIHWGQRALNRIGDATAREAARFAR